MPSGRLAFFRPREARENWPRGQGAAPTIRPTNARRVKSKDALRPGWPFFAHAKRVKIGPAARERLLTSYADQIRGQRGSTTAYEGGERAALFLEP